MQDELQEALDRVKEGVHPCKREDVLVYAAIRDNFNSFLQELEQFELMIQSNTIKAKSLRHYLKPWGDLVKNIDNGKHCGVECKQAVSDYIKSSRKNHSLLGNHILEWLEEYCKSSENLSNSSVQRAKANRLSMSSNEELSGKEKIMEDSKITADKKILEKAIDESEIQFNKVFKINERWNITLTLANVVLTLLATAFGTLGDSQVISAQTKNILVALFGCSAVAVQSIINNFPVRERARGNRNLRNRTRLLKSYEIKKNLDLAKFNEIEKEYRKILEDEARID